jgi:tetratricopeptide (TPR) repeat protein
VTKENSYFKGDSLSDSIKTLPKWTNYIFVGILIIACLATFQIFRADSARSIGDYDMSIKESQKDTINNVFAINNYNESAKLNPFEPLTWYEIWSASYDMGDYKGARTSIEKAIALFPKDGIYYSALATTDQAENATSSNSGYEQHLLSAIQYFPASDLTNVVRLADYYFDNKKYNMALVVINKVLPIYTHYQSVLWYSSDPNSPTMSENLVLLNNLKEKIENIFVIPASPETK